MVDDFGESESTSRRGAGSPPVLFEVSLASGEKAMVPCSSAAPTLDRIAAEGVLFEQGIAPFPSTTASHMSMLTSLEPCVHGVLGRETCLPTPFHGHRALGDARYAAVAVPRMGSSEGRSVSTADSKATATSLALAQPAVIEKRRSVKLGRCKLHALHSLDLPCSVIR